MYLSVVPARLLPLIIAIPCALVCADPNSATIELLERSQHLIREHRSAEAIKILENARMDAAKRNDTYSEALFLNDLGVAFAEQGGYLAAQNSFDASISRLTRLKGGSNPALIEPLNNLATLFYESDQAPQAEALVRRDLGIVSSAHLAPENTGAELNILAKMYLGERKFAQAQQSAEQGLRVLSETGHSDDLSAALGWSVLGSVYNERGDSKAEQPLRNAVDILEKRLPPQDYLRGEATANLGLFYVKQGSLQKAEPLLEKAHASFRANATNTLFVRQFLTVWSEVEKKAGHKRKAKALSNESRTLTASRSETSSTRYVLDANGFR